MQTKPLGHEVRQARSRHAAATRWGTPEQAAETRRDLAAARLEAYTRLTLTETDLTETQRRTIIALLTPNQEETQ